MSLLKFIKRKTSQKYRFELQYEGKKWDGLRGIAELGHYSIIVGLTKTFCPNARVLDLGCGEGVLLEKFGAADYVSYLGIDFSEVAIQNAQNIKNEKASFATGDLNKLEVAGQFDVIIYNESLYYLSNPQDAARTLFKNLSQNGVFIISMVDKRGKEQTDLWMQMDEIMALQDHTKVTNAKGDSWTVQVYRPKG